MERRVTLLLMVQTLSAEVLEELRAAEARQGPRDPAAERCDELVRDLERVIARIQAEVGAIADAA